MRRFTALVGSTVLSLAVIACLPTDARSDDASLVRSLLECDARALPAEIRERASRMLSDHDSARLRAANQKSSAEWAAIGSLRDWQQYRDLKLAALRSSLGRFPETPSKLTWHVTQTQPGDGYVIQCILFESRPGMWVSANLYVPAKPRESMPGIIISHSHHTSKTNGELQDMGMTWARLGAVVLVPDHFGHGERRQHPFSTDRDFAGSFRVSRQDYYFRYDLSVQAHLAGESYVGQLVWDLSRGVDLLLAQPGVDPKRIVLLGAVAGGGDPAAVAAALDERIQVAVPFNFGGPQPETTFPLPPNAETAFNYAGSGSWESTRNLKRSAVDGFLPWVIVGSIAPRRLVYGHEFSWDGEHDPVWKRLKQIYDWNKLEDGLAETHGFGSVRQQDASHCTHIGKLHRVAIHAAFARWLGLPDGATAEFSQRRESSELLCWNDEWRQRLKPRPWRDVLNDKVAAQFGPIRRRTATPTLEVRREHARKAWSQVLFDSSKATSAKLTPTGQETLNLGASEVTLKCDIQRFTLETEIGIHIPVVVLKPITTKKKPPVVLLISQAGKAELLKKRPIEIAALLRSGVAVCLLDPRGIGETSVGNDRDRSGEMTSRTSTQFMLGGSLLGSRLRDVLAVVAELRKQTDLDASRLSVWGDSTAPINSPDTQLVVPHAIDNRPQLAEPTGPLLALLLGLFDDQIRLVLAHGNLESFQSVLERPTVHIPHDAVIPDLLTLGDISDLVALLPSGRVRVSGSVTSGNQAFPSNTGDSITTGVEWIRAPLNEKTMP